MVGSRIGRYEIVERIGAGGMGEVYRAEDTTLGRPVALKFLASHLLHDDEAKQRFLREAKAAAAITHPNICHVYEVAEENGKTFLAMAYIEGESLEERIAKGPLPIKDALEIGRQVAEGLKAAHAKAIVHRDIKPANIMVDGEGQVTILDFGLARLAEASKLTRQDQTVGTTAYMSPEQLQGGDVDQRTDVWALGCVLYEMVAGLRPFAGQYDQALLYEICNQEPEPLTGLRAGVPMELEFIVGKCLAKDAGDRYEHASEIAVDLRTLADKMKSGRSAILSRAPMAAGAPGQAAPEGPLSGLRFREGATSQGAVTVYRADDPKRGESLVVRVAPEAVEQAQAKSTLIRRVGIGVGGVILGSLAMVYFWRAPPAPPPQTTSFAIPLDPDTFSAPRAYVSPDGEMIAYTDESRRADTPITLRRFRSLESSVMEGTEGARELTWSPDSRWIAFQQGRAIRKVSVDGGAPTTIADLERGGFIGDWSPDNQILASVGGDLFLFPAGGGEPARILDVPDEEIGYGSVPRFADPRAGQEKILFTGRMRRTSANNHDGDALFLHDVASGKTARLHPGWNGHYDSAAGRLLFNGPNLGVWAMELDLDNPNPDAEATQLIPGATLAGAPAAGTLVYISPREAPARQMVWRDRSGNLLGSIGRPQEMMQTPEISPDGRFVAVTSGEPVGRQIWIHENERPVRTSIPLDTANALRPMWSADTRALLFSRGAGRSRSTEIWRARTDGVGGLEVVYNGAAPLILSDWLPRIDRMAIQQEATGEGGREFDVLTLRLSSPSREYEVLPLVSSEANERAAKISPDGRFVAYCSNVSGADEIYVRPFDGGGGRWQVSTAGGIAPRWSDNGDELFYVQNRDTLIAVEVSTQPTFRIGEQRELFQSQSLYISATTGRDAYPAYDVASDGQRFVLVEPSGDLPPPELRVIRNWTAAFPDQ